MCSSTEIIKKCRILYKYIHTIKLYINIYIQYHKKNVGSWKQWNTYLACVKLQIRTLEQHDPLAQKVYDSSGPHSMSSTEPWSLRLHNQMIIPGVVCKVPNATGEALQNIKYVYMWYLQWIIKMSVRVINY